MRKGNLDGTNFKNGGGGDTVGSRFKKNANGCHLFCANQFGPVITGQLNGQSAIKIGQLK